MKRFNPILLVLSFLFALATFPAHGETLTDQKVRSFINTLQALHGMEDNYDDMPEGLDTDESEPGMENMSSIFSSSVEKMKGHRMYDDLKKAVQQHGFSSPEQWGETGDRIFRAWSALEMGQMDQQPSQMNQEMARAMEQIENNPNMSEAQKQQMRNMMGGAKSAMENAANAPEADKQAVRPHLEALRAATESAD